MKKHLWGEDLHGHSNMICYDEYGPRSQPALLLLHGAAALDTFHRLYDLSSRYRLIVPHLPGAGQAVGQPYHLAETKRALWALIDALGEDKLIVMGHSLGAQLAAALVSEHPERFSAAVLLSAWIDPSPRTVAMYLRLAPMTVACMKWRWLVRLQARYWRYPADRAERMAQDAASLTSEVYRSFFANTLRSRDIPGYGAVDLPMLAVCGSCEMKEMKASLQWLAASNPHCRAVLLPRAGHDFPMRRDEALRPLLLDFLSGISRQ